MKYLELINQSADETAKSNNALVAEAGDLALQSSMLECKKQIAEQKSKIAVLKSAIPFNAKNTIDALNKLDLLERELKQYQQLKEELF